MKGLILHCGAQLKSREEVFGVPVPQGTASWHPLSHESFVTCIAEQLTVEKIVIQEERLALSENGQRLFGLMEVEMKGFVQRDYGFVLGLRNSYDKSFPSAVCIGATVFVCDNLSFRGEITFKRNHSRSMSGDLAQFIARSGAVLPAKFLGQALAFEFYKRAPLTDRQVHDLAIRFVDTHAISITDIPKLLKEWRTPRHPEFARANKTAWRLFNAATDTLKGDLWRLPARTQRIHAILDETCGIRGIGNSAGGAENSKAEEMIGKEEAYAPAT